MGLAEVSAILWRERELLDLLLFKLEEEQLLVTSGSGRWLAHATREIEAVLDQLRRTEVLRAAEVDAVAAELGLPPNPSLRTLAEAAEEPWTDLLTQHRAAFLVVTEAIAGISADTRVLLSAGQRATYETLLAVGGAES